VYELAETRLLRSTEGNSREAGIRNKKKVRKNLKISALEAGLSSQSGPGGPWCFLACYSTTPAISFKDNDSKQNSHRFSNSLSLK
jgi:hypothetical protein